MLWRRCSNVMVKSWQRQRATFSQRRRATSPQLIFNRAITFFQLTPCSFSCCCLIYLKSVKTMLFQENSITWFSTKDAVKLKSFVISKFIYNIYSCLYRFIYICMYIYIYIYIYILYKCNINVNIVKLKYWPTK